MSATYTAKRSLRWIAFEALVYVLGYLAIEYLVPERFVNVGLAVGLCLLVVSLVLVPAVLYRRGRRTNEFYPAV